MSKTKPASIVAACPFPDQALDQLWEWIEGARSQVADDFSPATPDEFIALERARQESGEVITFGIYRDGELGGYVRVVPMLPHLCECHCIFKREFYGTQTTLPGLNDVARQLFEAGIERLTLPVFADNAAIRALVKKLGAVEEGRLREYTRQNGQPVDMLIFGLLKRDWEAKRQEAGSRKQEAVSDCLLPTGDCLLPPNDPAPKLESDAWPQQPDHSLGLVLQSSADS